MEKITAKFKFEDQILYIVQTKVIASERKQSQEASGAECSDSRASEVYQWEEASRQQASRQHKWWKLSRRKCKHTIMLKHIDNISK